MTITLRCAALGGLMMVAGHGARAALNLEKADVVCPPNLTRQEQKAVTLLIDEVEKRTRVRWPQTNSWPSGQNPIILVGTAGELEVFTNADLPPLPAAAQHPEGFQLRTTHNAGRTVVSVIGRDSRGVLFGIGRLLRELRMRPRTVEAPKLDIASAPAYPLRGHQLGYRPKCNSYDAWDVPTWEQYYRDLAVFGCNAVELIPPRSDDDATSPHFPKPPMEMMIEMSRLADDYGLDVWIWYPAMDRDYSDPKTVEFALQEWGNVFQKLPRIDAVFVPGGDPGHTRPNVLLALLQKQSENLHRFHPRAQMWVSPQSFSQQWLNEFLDQLNRERPAWLNGIVFGPQVRIPLAELRRRVPGQYPIRHYPDITHSRQCQFPVPNWDVAYAVTEARECINPRPVDQAAIFRKLQPDTIGFITYSEGCNDDVNKFIWSGLGWNPSTPVSDILQEYSRYFIGPDFERSFADGLLALERDWRGPLSQNKGVEKTLQHFQKLEAKANPAALGNWRFQQALFRACYDAYTRRRLLHESSAEANAMTILRKELAHAGALAAMASAENVLDQAASENFEPKLKARILDLGEALFKSIRMQLSVEKYKAIAVDRGACLDTLDFPLNNRLWLKQRFAAIRKMKSGQETALETILRWSDPGPGGFYDDLGNGARQPHLLPGAGFNQDPGCFASARVDFEEDLVVDEPDERAAGARRVSWIDHAESLYDAPLQLRYRGLDPAAHYKLRVVYAGDSFKKRIRLEANGIEIHPYLNKSPAVRPLEFTIPPSATARGVLTLSWFGEPGLGGNGRNAQVSEVWLVKEPTGH